MHHKELQTTNLTPPSPIVDVTNEHCMFESAYTGHFESAEAAAQNSLKAVIGTQIELKTREKVSLQSVN